MKKTLTFKKFLVLLKDAFWGWDSDGAWRLGAALAYFTVFSIGPLLIIVLVITGSIFGKEATQGRVMAEIQELVGRDGARAIEQIMENVYTSESSIPAAFFGFIMLLFGATGVFVQLRESLDLIWRIKPKPISTIKGYLKGRLISFTMIVTIGFLLLVSLIISAGLTALSRYLGDRLPMLDETLYLTDIFISFVFITVLFALMFKILPDAIIRWRDVWVGAAVTSFLFTIGKWAIGFYLGNSEIGSTFGAASSLVIIMLWAFYSALIFLYGAEFTKLYAQRFGANILPSKNAVRFVIQEVEIEKPKTKNTEKAMDEEKVTAQ
jgi:membrane protein